MVFYVSCSLNFISLFVFSSKCFVNEREIKNINHELKRFILLQLTFLQ